MRATIFAALALLGCRTLGYFNADATEVTNPRHWQVLNGKAEQFDDGGKKAIKLAPTGGNHEKGSNVALAVARGFELTTGTIEVDLKGNPDGQSSFLGVAFNIKSPTEYEAIYFRPFNFKADGDNHGHAVQYVSWPNNTWEALRNASPGKYEAALEPAPDPVDWFHARIEVGDKDVKVFVNGSATPSLTVDRLATPTKTKAALFVDSQPGAFKELSLHES